MSDTTDYSKYLIHSSAEIVQILRDLQKRGAMITAYFNQGKDFLLTSVVDADAERVILDYAPDASMCRRMLESPKVVFMTNQDKVKIQFGAAGVQKVSYSGNDAFRIAVPSSLLKLQRREFFRISTPMGQPLKCEVPLPDGSKIMATLADVSLGGMGLYNIPKDKEAIFETGATFKKCRINIPQLGLVEADFVVRSSYEITLKSGGKVVRYGCEFASLPHAMQAILQRYITQLERDRRSKEL